MYIKNFRSKKQNESIDQLLYYYSVVGVYRLFKLNTSLFRRMKTGKKEIEFGERERERGERDLCTRS